MDVIENTEIFPPRKHFVDIDEKFTNFIIGCRVIPASYFNDPNVHFTLRAKYLPGEKKSFPNGGFEVYGPEGNTFNFELDQLMVHPFHFGMMKYFSKTQDIVKEKVTTGEKGKRGRPRKDPSELKTQVVYVPTGGTRGRKPMDPELKALKEAELAEKRKNSTGKRGRPAMDPILKAARELEKLEKPKSGKGRFGREKVVS